MGRCWSTFCGTLFAIIAAAVLLITWRSSWKPRGEIIHDSGSNVYAFANDSDWIAMAAQEANNNTQLDG